MTALRTIEGINLGSIKHFGENKDHIYNSNLRRNYKYTQNGFGIKVN
jgi:hypothetical protein